MSENEWPDDSPAGRAPQTELTANYIRLFVESILHGDEDHRLWLKEAAECFIDGRPMPDRPCPCLKPEQPQDEQETARYWYEQWVERGAQLAAQADRFHELLDEVGAKNWGITGEQPQEWIPISIKLKLRPDEIEALHKIHNAALAAADERWQHSAIEGRKQLYDMLAAEQEKVRILTEQMQKDFARQLK
jgi:hypothetical protein